MHHSITLPFASDDNDDRHYAVYVFRQREGSSLRISPLHLRWQRESVTQTIEAALTHAALARDEDGVKRVQIYEMIRDKNGLVRTGRIIKTLSQTFWRKLRRRHQ